MSDTFQSLRSQERYKSGRKKPKKAKANKKISKNAPNPTALQKRLSYLDPRHINQPEAAHLMGCLYLNDVIDETEYRTSKIIAKHLSRYRTVMGFPKANVQVIKLDRVVGTEEFEPTEKNIEISKRNIEQIEDVCWYMGDESNQGFTRPHQFRDRAYKILVDILEKDIIPSTQWREFSFSLKFKILKVVLNELADIYKIR